MIIIFRKSTLSPSGNVWSQVVLSGLLCFGFACNAFEASQNVASHSNTPQASTLSDKLPSGLKSSLQSELSVELDLPVVLRANEKRQPIPYQPMQQNSINIPQLRDWKQSNNRVKDLGGWMFYASEAATADDTIEHDHQDQHQHVETIPVKDQP